jgi:toxin secretion/phage lysis holin
MKFEQGIFASIGAVLVPVFHFFYGEGEARYVPIILILLLVVMDWLSGTSAAKKDGIYSSEYGIEGIKRTSIILLLPSVGHLLDIALGLPGMIFGLFAFGIIYHLLKSCLANMIRSGWGNWIPQRAMEWVLDEIEHKVARSSMRKSERNKYIKGGGEDGEV